MLVEALGPRLTKLQLHYVENFDLAAIATVAHCCQGLKCLEVAALVGSRYVGEGYEEEPYIAQIRRMEEAEVGNFSNFFVKSNVAAEEDAGAAAGTGRGGCRRTMQLKGTRHPSLVGSQPPENSTWRQLSAF